MDTYGELTIDHVYISEGLKNSGISVKAEIRDEYYMQVTDHKIIAVILEAA
ncbi:hypothetical protein H0486_07910 [Lachnospiraceae bacterium MD1]|uniref:Uncharacterized protein n=1 Tax=Variimorphobacter saccharofermentans TaxID=2755051 RepID=A0A839K1H3_9FIRM|nr:hypothetical protein [Variimorphobacter saccharofermentans]MBB2182799.1 hypothetical protein [Variimorphobacter saccharofermentans]